MQPGLPFDEPLAPPSRSTLTATSESVLVPTSGSAPAPPTHPLAPIYFARHRRARRYLLRVEQDGRVRVTIPRGGSRREADAFARRHVEWVARQRARLTPAVVDPTAHRALRMRARRELPPALLTLAAVPGVAVTRVSIRNQRTRWGSCGRDGHIRLNWRLLLMPDWVREYVLVHELMHLRRMDHSPTYWRYVAAAYPRYQEAREWLRANGPALR